MGSTVAVSATVSISQLAAKQNIWVNNVVKRVIADNRQCRWEKKDMSSAVAAVFKGEDFVSNRQRSGTCISLTRFICDIGGGHFGVTCCSAPLRWWVTVSPNVPSLTSVPHSSKLQLFHLVLPSRLDLSWQLLRTLISENSPVGQPMLNTDRWSQCIIGRHRAENRANPVLQLRKWRRGSWVARF